MNTYIPGMKALWMAENVTPRLHNIYTLRGTPVRDALNWSKYIDEALYRFGQEAEVMFAAHHWPRWGNDRIQEVLRAQRDIYANMQQPGAAPRQQRASRSTRSTTSTSCRRACSSTGTCRGYHGSPEHNARGVIQRYPGLLGLQPGHADPAVARGLGPALRRDDGRGGGDPRPRQRSFTTRATTCWPSRS